MRRGVGMDIRRTFGEALIWEDGKLRHAGRVDMTRTALEGFGKRLLPTDEIVIEATGNCMAVSRVLSPLIARVVIANPLQVNPRTSPTSCCSGGTLDAERGHCPRSPRLSLD